MEVLLGLFASVRMCPVQHQPSGRAMSSLSRGQWRDFAGGLWSADWPLLDVPGHRRLDALGSLGLVPPEDVVANDPTADCHLLTGQPELVAAGLRSRHEHH